MQKMTKLHLVMGLAVGLLLTSCSVSQRYHHRGLSIQWRSVGKQVSNKIHAPNPKITDDRTDTKEMETIGSVTKDAHDAVSEFSVSSRENSAQFEAIHFSEFIPKVTEIAVGKPFSMEVSKTKFQPIHELQRKLKPPMTYKNSNKFRHMANKSLIFALLCLTPLILFFIFQLLSIYYGIEAIKHIPKGHKDRNNAYAGIALSIFLLAIAICFWLFAAGWGRL